MILHYIWIKEYCNIKEQGFHFTDKYTISFDINTEVLSIKENEKHLPNFFGENIESITGIIGENGTGKSNLLNFIMQRLASFHRGSWSSFKDNQLQGIFILDNGIYCHTSLNISNLKRLQKEEFNIFYFNESIGTYGKTRLKVNKHDYDDEIHENRYLNYSNIFDYGFNGNWYEHFDISTNGLISNAGHYYSQYNSYYPNENKIDRLSKYVEEETKRQIQFVYEYQTIDNIIPFQLPNEIYIALDEKKNSIPYDFWELKGLIHLRGIHTQNSIYTRPKNQKDKSSVFLKLFLNKLMDFLIYSYPEAFKNFTDENYRTFIYENDYRGLMSILDNEIVKQILNLRKALDKIVKNVKFPDHEKITYRDFASDFEKYGAFTIEIKKTNLSSLNEFIQLSFGVLQNKNFLNFFWEGLSSGQLNMLILYSRFYYATKNYLDYEPQHDQYKHIIILVDEGETYFHPKWQADFLRNVLTFLKKIIPNKTIQIVITSNSPFIASDLPKSCINFLSRDTNGNCQVQSGLSQHKETFGANIHTLYTDAFFMPNSLMGTFAKDKIMKLISVINGDLPFDSEIPDLDSIQAHINILGEPILKTQLQKQLDSLRLKKIDEIDLIKGQMRILSRRLKRLEEENNDTN
jgi:hypothetical protein